MSAKAQNGPGGKPVGGREFARLMASLEPFGPSPVVAVGVSGGADSMALALLARDWTARRGGRAIGLVVDHGLRPGSAGEARRVRGWLRQRGLEAHILRWRAAKPGSGVQAAARDARYRLLARWCEKRKIRHLMVAHHLDDQAETLLMRLARGSGVDGLAAMAPARSVPFADSPPGVRLLRPLLAVSRARLRGTLLAAGQEWLEDPSNSDRAFTRVRVRQALAGLGADGPAPRTLGRTAARMGRARSALEQATAELMARAVRLDGAGYCLLDLQVYRKAPEETGLRALARILKSVGGLVFPPRSERLERLHDVLGSGGRLRARTLGGCRVLPAAGGAGGWVVVCREPVACQGPLPLTPGGPVLWDGRFRVSLTGGRGGGAAGFRVERLGRAGWAAVSGRREDLKDTAVPAPARAVLPALWDRRGVVSVPLLGYLRPGAEAVGGRFSTVFAPPEPLFEVAPGILHIT